MFRKIVVAAVFFAVRNENLTVEEKFLQGAFGEGSRIPCMGFGFASALDVL